MKIELVSKQWHKFGGKVRKPGERYFATQDEAKVLLKRRRVVEVQAPAAVVEDKPKRAYKRRDMQAETLQDVPSFPNTVAALSTESTLAPEPVAPRGFSDEVAKIREGFRDAFAPKPPKQATKPADAPRETITRPKKSEA